MTQTQADKRSAVSSMGPSPKPYRLYLAATVGLVGMGIVAAGSGITRSTAYGGLALSQMLITAAVLVVSVLGTMWAWGKYREAKNTYDTYDPERPEATEVPQEMVGADMPKEARTNMAVARLCHIMFGIDQTVMPIWKDFEFDDDKNLVSYGFRSRTPGFYAKESTKNRVDEALTNSLGQGWAVTFDSQNDTVSATKKSALPRTVFPEMWKVVGSAKEAASFYPDFTVYIGVGENGPIGFKPKSVPHRELVGATGGGKSVAARAELAQYQAAGFRIFAVDGKGTDYSPYVQSPNYSAISTTLADHVILIHKVWMILQARRAKAEQMSIQGDNSWRTSFTPVLLMLDEFASVRSNMKEKYSSKELDSINRDIADLLKVGREFRVHVLLATQDMKAETVKTDWLDMLIVQQSLGRPGDMTIRKAFPSDIQGEVRRLGNKISRDTPGRALVSMTNADGQTTAQLYQAYFSYSPAEDISKAKGAQLENWREFKERVTDQVPRLYPREWVVLEYPEPDSGKDPYKDYRDDGWVDVDKMTVQDLHKLKPVALDDPETLEPIPENAIYDRRSRSFIGRAPLGQEASAGVIDI